MNIVTFFQNRLRDGGWERIRKGAHEIWRHPNGATHALSITMHDGPLKKQMLHDIEKAERGPAIQEEAMVQPVSVAVMEQPLECPLGACDAPLEPMDMAEWMKVTRTATSLSATDLADLMTTFGWKKATVGNIENKLRRVTNAEFTEWLEIFGVVAPPADIVLRFAPPRPDFKASELAPRLIPKEEPMILQSPESIAQMAFAKKIALERVEEAKNQNFIPGDPEREAHIVRAVKLLRNSHLSNLEVGILVGALKEDITQILLGGVE